MSYQKLATVFIGRLPPHIHRKDIKKLCLRYGEIKFIHVRHRSRWPPFAYVEFQNPRDAAAAVKDRKNCIFDGYKLRIEFAISCGLRRKRMHKQRRPAAGHFPYRVKVKGLPRTASWQDLKDHMRPVGSVNYVTIFEHGTGVVEFLTWDSMELAVNTLNKSKFRSHKGETTYIRVKKDYPGSYYRGSGMERNRSCSSSDTPRPRGSPTYSPMRRRESNRSRSRSYRPLPRGSPTYTPMRRSERNFLF